MKKILVIDDEPGLTDILQEIFHRLGYLSDSAHTGEAAVELMKKNGYWAVFCDLKMPGMNGLELYEETINLNGGRSRRFVLLTGAILDARTEEELAGQQIIMCRKPFHFQHIQETLRTLESLP